MIDVSNYLCLRRSNDTNLRSIGTLHGGMENRPDYMALQLSIELCPNAMHAYDDEPMSMNNARFTPNRDQLRTDLRVEKFWISWTREQSLNINR